jgi:hypothetical protein
MQGLIREVWEMMVGRLHGPFAFRLIIQPVVAAVLAIRAGLEDARTGRPAYGWAVVTDKVQRGELICEGWKHLSRLFLAAVIVDMIYEIIVFHWIYPGQALLVAVVVAVPSYLLLRGPANRLARILRRNRRAEGAIPLRPPAASAPAKKDQLW